MNKNHYFLYVLSISYLYIVKRYLFEQWFSNILFACSISSLPSWEIDHSYPISCIHANTAAGLIILTSITFPENGCLSVRWYSGARTVYLCDRLGVGLLCILMPHRSCLCTGPGSSRQSGPWILISWGFWQDGDDIAGGSAYVCEGC